jgi:hypothetical protein
MICVLTKHNSGDQIQNEMGGACSTHGGRGEVLTGFWWGNVRERDQLEDPGVHGRITLISIFRKWDGGGMDWIELAQDRDGWWVLVTAVTNLRVP